MPRRDLPLHIIGMDGLGDSIYQRPFVKMSARRFTLFFRTAWPELYSDINVKLTRTTVQLRTQQKNVDLQPAANWAVAPKHCQKLNVRYGFQELARSNIVQALERQFPHADGTYNMDLPNFGPCPVSTTKPIALVRPATIRQEWIATARSPKAEYIQQAINILSSRGFHVVSVADCDGVGEWFDGREPQGMHTKLHKGELSYARLMALLQHSTVCVGGLGWLAPAAVAAKKPLFLIYGGRGAHNAPEVIFDPRMDLTKVGWATPTPFCRCTEAEHDCNKRIERFAKQFEQWLSNLNLAPRAGNGLLSGGPNKVSLWRRLFRQVR